jgi:hypothetical protein
VLFIIVAIELATPENPSNLPRLCTGFADFAIIREGVGVLGKIRIVAGRVD